MTNSEFKAWFEGFVEGMEGMPTKKQWARVQQKVKEINGQTISTIYVDRYIDRWYPHIAPIWYSPTYGSTADSQAVFAANTYTKNGAVSSYGLLHDEGMREAQSLAA